jgi:hypothetical protein
MDYRKPEVTRVGSGMLLVQGGKSLTSGHDSSEYVTTMGAYEADE